MDDNGKKINKLSDDHLKGRTWADTGDTNEKRMVEGITEKSLRDRENEGRG